MSNETNQWNPLQEEIRIQFEVEAFYERFDSLIEQCNYSTINLLLQIRALKESSRLQDRIAKVAIIKSSTNSLCKILEDYQKREMDPYLHPPHERGATQEEKIGIGINLEDNQQSDLPL